ncbi:MAG: HDOD domain-containing protein [Gammaproteobacteria bacterium]|nr:HDOD domain-containing protein [Gammaproteobacteria bacterium]
MDINKKKIRVQFETLESLPPLPQIAQKILQLRSNPNQNIKNLAKIIELDPSLSAQVIRYAKSPLYGYQGKIADTESAISRVLGYDTVLNLALSLATTKPFALPRKGPLGAEAFWRRAISCAVMSQKLAPSIPKAKNVTSSMAYLAGLLHEIGLLAIAHLQPKLFKELNDNDNNTSLIERERTLLAITHAEAGARLMRHWQLPDEIIISNLKCGSPRFTGIHAEYSLLLYLSNTLNKASPISEKTIEEHPECAHIISFLEINPENVIYIFNEINNNLTDIDSMARLLAA